MATKREGEDDDDDEKEGKNQSVNIEIGFIFTLNRFLMHEKFIHFRHRKRIMQEMQIV